MLSKRMRGPDNVSLIYLRDVLVGLDDASNEAIVTIHWIGGRHTELRVSRVRCGRYPEGPPVSPVEAVRKLGGNWPDREVASTLNRMRCKPSDNKA